MCRPYVKEFLPLGAHDKALMPSSHSGRLHLICNQDPKGHVSPNLTLGSNRSIRPTARIRDCLSRGEGSIPSWTAYSISMELVQIQQRRQPVKGRQPSVKYLVCGLILLMVILIDELKT